MRNRSHAWNRCTGLLLGLIGVWTTASASDADQGHDAFDRNWPKIKAALSSQGDADSLAVIAVFGDREAGLNTLGRAAALAPDRADLAWLEIVTCAHAPACDPEPFSATLHRLDPDNGAAFAVLLDRARRRGDLVAENQSLKSIAASKRYDIYWNVTTARMATALLKVRAADTPTVLTEVLARQAAFAIPAFTNVSLACKRPELDEPGRLDDCRHVAAALRSGDTYLTEMLGIAIAKRLWPEDSAEYADAVAARRLGKYRLTAQLASMGSMFGTGKEAQQYLDLLQAHRSEQEVTLALIMAAGNDVSPPPDWKESASASF